MALQIKAATSADEPFLWEMLYQAIYLPPGQPPAPWSIVFEPELSRYVQGWGRPDDVGFMAWDEVNPVGAVWLRLLNDENKGFGYVDETTPELSIAVLPAYRGQGIGTRLMAHLLEAVRARYSAICLSVSPDNPAKGLYQRFGFEVVDTSGTSLTLVRRRGGFETKKG
jgi:ribosomal protein S18 acetylase RimI-like enzyme